MRKNNFTYPEDIGEHSGFQTLYARWKALVNQNVSAVFTDFEKFFRWSINNGYEYGKRLVLIDPNGQYAPGNCEWVDISSDVKSGFTKTQQEEAIRAWNKAVNKIRSIIDWDHYREQRRKLMGKAKMIGQYKPYSPNSKMDARYQRKVEAARYMVNNDKKQGEKNETKQSKT